MLNYTIVTSSVRETPLLNLLCIISRWWLNIDIESGLHVSVDEGNMHAESGANVGGGAS